MATNKRTVSGDQRAVPDTDAGNVGDGVEWTRGPVADDDAEVTCTYRCLCPTGAVSVVTLGAGKCH